MAEFALIGLRAIAVAGIVIVLNQHVHMAWWEGCVLSFGIMVLFGSNRV